MVPNFVAALTVKCNIQYPESAIEKFPRNLSAECLVQILSKQPPCCQVYQETDCQSVAYAMTTPVFCEESKKALRHMDAIIKIMWLDILKK